MLQHLPNTITIARLLLVPVMILFLKQGQYGYALTVFLVAGVSDALDGFIARRFGLITHLGAVLDPLADKLLLISAYVMLAWLGQVPFWLLLIVGFRDLFIIGGYLVVTSMLGPVRMRPSYLSKLNTLTQIGLVVALLLRESVIGSIPEDVVGWLVWLVTATTVLSGVHYAWLWLVKKEIEPVAGNTSTEEREQ